MKLAIRDWEDAEDEVERRGSYGERQLAHMLADHGVRYFYEHPVAVIDRGKVRVWYSDFWLPDFGVVVEYAGMMDNPDYAAGMRHKEAVYEAMGIPCLRVEPSDLAVHGPEALMDQIHDVLLDRLDNFDPVETQLLLYKE